MNALTVRSQLQDQNERLLELRSRMRRAVARICGTPPSGKLADVPSAVGPTPAAPNYIDELSDINTANSILISDLANELIWLESVFDLTSDSPEKAYR